MTSKARILLVDDYAVVRSGLRALLQGEPDVVVVGEAENAETAVILADTLQPDLIILDMLLPDFDGVDVIKAVRRRQPQIRIFILSNAAEPQRVREALAAGAAAYWIKDSNNRRFLAALRRVLAGETALHPSLAPR